MLKTVVGAAFVAFVFVAAGSSAPAQESRQNEAGQFDFYVLSLSWSPSFCAAAAERDGARARPCNAARGPIRSSCTACGRNTTRDFRNIARSRRRDSTAASFLRCSI
jgi:hypothetical protein